MPQAAAALIAAAKAAPLAAAATTISAASLGHSVVSSRNQSRLAKQAQQKAEAEKQRQVSLAQRKQERSSMSAAQIGARITARNRARRNSMFPGTIGSGREY